MMSSAYRFICKSCKYECISGVGVEKGLHYSKVVMVCGSCKEVGTYAVPNPGALLNSPVDSAVCKTCHSSDYLSPWDGLACPQCGMHMKAIGSNIKAIRAWRYW
jgi:hypothetical protein